MKKQSNLPLLIILAIAVLLGAGLVYKLKFVDESSQNFPGVTHYEPVTKDAPYLGGTVSKLASGKIYFQTADGKTFTALVNNQTRYLKQISGELEIHQAKLSDIKVGTKIFTQIKDSDSEEFSPWYVEIVP